MKIVLTIDPGDQTDALETALLVEDDESIAECLIDIFETNGIQKAELLDEE